MRRAARTGSWSSTRSIRLPRISNGSALISRPSQGASALPAWSGSRVAEMGWLFSIICLTSFSGCRESGWLRAVNGLLLFNLFGRHGGGDGLAVNSELLRSQRDVIAHKLNYVPDVAVLHLVQQ